MAWLIIGIIGLCVIVIVAIAFGRGKIVVRWGEPFTGGESTKVEVIERENYSAAVGPGEQVKSLDELPPDVRIRIEQMLESGRNKSEKIIIEQNGERREYSSMEDVPPEFRSRFESAIGDGRRQGVQRQIVIKKDGKTYTYNSIDEVPPEFRIFLRRKE